MTFELNPDLTRDLPAAAATILQEFVAVLAASLGSALESVILFGSAAEGRLRVTSDVNLLVVASDWTLEQLDSVREPLRSGRGASLFGGGCCRNARAESDVVAVPTPHVSAASLGVV